MSIVITGSNLSAHRKTEIKEDHFGNDNQNKKINNNSLSPFPKEDENEDLITNDDELISKELFDSIVSRDD